MSAFLYAVGSIMYQTFTLWLAVIGVHLVWDICVSKCCRQRNRIALESWSFRARFSFGVTTMAIMAATIDSYLLTPTLGAGINFFFAG